MSCFGNHYIQVRPTLIISIIKFTYYNLFEELVIIIRSIKFPVLVPVSSLTHDHFLTIYVFFFSFSFSLSPYFFNFFLFFYLFSFFSSFYIFLFPYAQRYLKTINFFFFFFWLHGELKVQPTRETFVYISFVFPFHRNHAKLKK